MAKLTHYVPAAQTWISTAPRPRRLWESQNLNIALPATIQRVIVFYTTEEAVVCKNSLLTSRVLRQDSARNSLREYSWRRHNRALAFRVLGTAGNVEHTDRHFQIPISLDLFQTAVCYRMAACPDLSPEFRSADNRHLLSTSVSARVRNLFGIGNRVGTEEICGDATRRN